MQAARGPTGNVVSISEATLYAMIGDIYASIANSGVAARLVSPGHTSGPVHEPRPERRQRRWTLDDDPVLNATDSFNASTGLVTVTGNFAMTDSYSAFLAGHQTDNLTGAFYRVVSRVRAEGQLA